MKPSVSLENLQSHPASRRIPTRRDALVFRVKAVLLQARRAGQDARDGVTRFPRGDIEQFPHIVAESRTPLWVEEGLAERAAQLGKVQNLRAALQRLNGVEIPAGELFSFWKNVGQATTRRGFVPGRLLREGCMIQAVGGGLCQLSNALYEVALKGDCEIVERWGHSQIVPGSAAEVGRDATVAWNYIDLRFRPVQTILFEANLTATELVVRLRSREKPPQVENASLLSVDALLSARPVIDTAAHSCVSCGQHACFRHARPSVTADASVRTAWLIDECWPEFRGYAGDHNPHDVLGLAIAPRRWRPVEGRYKWNIDGYARVHDALLATLWNSWQMRRLGHYGARRLQAQLDNTRRLAATLARVLAPDTTHVVVAQSLLPFLWQEGHLGGRTFDVLMTRLPLFVMHKRLDDALRTHPESATLGEYRAPQGLVEAEAEALRAATRIVTPHSEIASFFPGRVHKLKWNQPQPVRNPRAVGGRAIAFVGPTAARKGAYELREAARRLDLEVVLCGSELEGANFWQGITTRRAGPNWLDGVCAVVQPALIEDSPRRLLSALAAGVPVIATPACGLEGLDAVITVPWGNVDALGAALTKLFDASITAQKPVAVFV